MSCITSSPPSFPQNTRAKRGLSSGIFLIYDEYIMSRSKKNSEILVRNFIFGVEDSLVSTVGLLSGIAVAGVEKREIFLTGVVLIFVEAFSMGIGSFLSEETAEELTSQKVKAGTSALGATIMFVSYFVAGMIPLLPYVVTNLDSAFIFSNAFTLLSLFILGALSAKIYKRPILKIGIKLLIMGGFAVFVGILVGRVFSSRPTPITPSF